MYKNIAICFIAYQFKSFIIKQNIVKYFRRILSIWRGKRASNPNENERLWNEISHIEDLSMFESLLIFDENLKSEKSDSEISKRYSSSTSYKSDSLKSESSVFMTDHYNK
ncbi:hypothetical protein NPIL_115481 [Nephila pilipes]|uniref:Uncharacterized protein n=1 Tax=Nephila pilipes TaxID=299642 RepID=A0A8X6UF42_NEPPI|nr:hypothetical protein NPIL_115481 [Nephila pilipes]